MKINELIRILFKPGLRLSHRIVTASAWTVIIRVSGRLLSFVRIIILARLLSPTAFGLVGVGLLGIDLITTLSVTGFKSALVQKKGDIRDYLDTAWVTAIVRSLFLALILYFCALPIANFFGSPSARPIVQVMASLIFINGFTNTGIIYLRKELEVQKQFVYEMSQIVADLAVSIPAAFILRNEWALVLGAVASNITGVAVSFIIHPYRPHFRFDLQKARTLYNFGKWVTVSSWIDYINSRGDSIFIGRLIGVEGLGLYQMARRIADIISTEIAFGISNVIFPAYSKLQNNIPRIRQGFLMSLETLGSVVLPLGVAISMLAPIFTPVIFGEQWLKAVPTMQVMGIAASISCLSYVGRSLFYGIGRPELAFYMTLIQTAVTFALFFPFYQLFDLPGGALAVLFGAISPYPLFIARSMKLLEIKPLPLLRTIIAPLAISLVVLAVSAISIRYILIPNAIIHLIVITAILGVFTVGVTFLLWRRFTIGPLQVISLLRRQPVIPTEQPVN